MSLVLTRHTWHLVFVCGRQPWPVGPTRQRMQKNKQALARKRLWVSVIPMKTQMNEPAGSPQPCADHWCVGNEHTESVWNNSRRVAEGRQRCILMLLRSLNISNIWFEKKNNRAFEELAHFLRDRRYSLQSNVQRGAVGYAFFKLPVWYLSCNVICYHVASFAICWLCKKSLSSAAARLPVRFVPVALSEPQ